MKKEIRLTIDTDKLSLEDYATLVMIRAVNDYDGLEECIHQLIKFHDDYFNGLLDGDE